MCLRLKWNSKIEVAQEDITCWKVVMTLRDGRWMAPYRRTVHEYDTELEACGHLAVERNYFKEDVINKGFHGYTFQYVLQGDEVLYHVRVVECTIPKGAEYCYGTGGDIVANKIIVHKPKEI